MNTEEILNGISRNEEIIVSIEDSKWKEHSIYDAYEEVFEYKENELQLTTEFNDNIFDEPQKIAIKHYLEHENTFYTMFIDKFIESQFKFDEWFGYDFESYMEDNDIEIPDKISLEWIKTNVKLIAINIDVEKDGYAFLEFDFAVSWDDEHGLRALVYKDDILAFSEGGICWSYELDDYDVEASTDVEEDVEEKAQVLKAKLDAYKSLKVQRNAKENTTKILLTYPIVEREVIPEEIFTHLEGNWYKSFIYVDGDLVLNGDLDLDELHEHADGIVINGNLQLNGGICNLEGDYGIALIVSGDVLADYVVGGGSEIYLLGHTDVHSFVVGHYNHGILEINDINVAVEVNSDHHSVIYGEIGYKFDDYHFLHDELGKIYVDKNDFAQLEYDEEEAYYSISIDDFNEELMKNDDVLLKNLLEHFLEQENLFKSLRVAKINKDNVLIKELEESLVKYVTTYEGDSYDYDDYEDEYEDWEEYSQDESPYNFKLYNLDELEKLNSEIDESKLLSNTWWQNARLFLSKEGLQTVGLIITKIKYMTSSKLEDLNLKDRDNTFIELDTFSGILNSFYKKEQSINLVLLSFILLLLWWYPQSVVLYMFIIYYGYLWFKKYISFSKNKEWIFKAKMYTEKAKVNNLNTKEEDAGSLDDTLAFMRYTTAQDKENWSVKLFDFIANLFKGKR